jgi:hypothetical protein
MAKLGLFDMPGEIRDKIYEDALTTTPDAISIRLRPMRDSPLDPKEEHLQGFRCSKDGVLRPLQLTGVALLRTCKRVLAEATPVLYGRNHFIFIADNGMISEHGITDQFFAPLPRQLDQPADMHVNMALIRHIEVVMPALSDSMLLSKSCSDLSTRVKSAKSCLQQVAARYPTVESLELVFAHRGLLNEAIELEASDIHAVASFSALLMFLSKTPKALRPQLTSLKTLALVVDEPFPKRRVARNIPQIEEFGWTVRNESTEEDLEGNVQGELISLWPGRGTMIQREPPFIDHATWRSIFSRMHRDDVLGPVTDSQLSQLLYQED